MDTKLLHLFGNFASTDLEAVVSRFSTRIVLVATISIIILVVLAVYLNKNKHAAKFKSLLFFPILIITVATTLAISGATVYLNVKSATGGPVHWHADIEFWACDNQLELRDPKGALNNKIGSPTLHEHNDKRIHLEGVPVELPEDASLGKFMTVIGGEISTQSLVLPVNDSQYFTEGHAGKGDEVTPYITDGTSNDGKYARLVNGQSCGAEVGEVQLFAYKFDEATKTYSQSKISDPNMYQISGQSEVPPGDCLIVEFGPKKDRTNHLCEQYGIRDSNRCEEYGVKPEERHICTNHEVMKGDK